MNAVPLVISMTKESIIKKVIKPIAIARIASKRKIVISVAKTSPLVNVIS